jgi:hypothetical protein
LSDLTPGIVERDEVLDDMAEFTARGIAPEDWPPRLRLIFAMACWPKANQAHIVRRSLQIEFDKALQLVTFFWPDRTTLEQVPPWIKELSSPEARDQDLEHLAEHVRQHLIKLIRLRRERKGQANTESSP